jgi:hypothetical protein
MKTPAFILASLLAAACAFPAQAGIELVTLPEREAAQLTIYNSADLTLVRDTRKLTLTKGINKLSFGWADTLIDPTSLSLRAVQRPDAVQLLDVAYPPRVNTEGLWTVNSRIEGEVPVEISYFTSGITWRAFYMATLAQDETAMRLQGYVRVTNHSGEDYGNAATRLVVGKVHLLDRIAELARRTAPYGTPGYFARPEIAYEGARKALMRSEAAGMAMAAPAPMREKEIIKEGLSEYFLYTIEGTETIPDRWSKRLPSFEAGTVPVENLYKFDERLFGDQVVRFLYFKNDKAHLLGDTPLPDGLVTVYRVTDGAEHLSYEGACPTKYIPVEQKAELNLGATSKVAVEPRLMKTGSERYRFDARGNIDGWETVEDWKIEVRNNRELPARVELTRHLSHQYFDLRLGKEEQGKFEKEDLDTVKFTLEMKPYGKQIFTYQVRYFEGERRNPR